MEEIKIKIIETTDIHGHYFPYDFIEKKKSFGGLSCISSFIKKERKLWGENLLLLDNGDIIQGQPAAYYYNFIDKKSKHLCARILNYLKYDAATMGNHDIEAGKEVYDRLVRDSNFPWLSANSLKDNGKGSYFKPYTIKCIEGIKLAVLGMTTPSIPAWLPKNLWPDMHFADVEKSAREWISILKSVEKPDLIIGLFHIGYGSNVSSSGIEENGGLKIAKELDDLDILLLGHDHKILKEEILNKNKGKIYVLNPGPFGEHVGEVVIKIYKEKGKIIGKKIETALSDMTGYKPDQDFIQEFRPDYKAVSSFVSKQLGVFTETVRSVNSYFGPAFFVDIIHGIQMEVTRADISFAAPLSYNTQIKKGRIRVSDLFKLYRYENILYTMELSGYEIKNYLEFSYSHWCNIMESDKDHLFVIQYDPDGKTWKFRAPYYNFDSAAGISYTVDARKSYGEKILIDSDMKNGKKFLLENRYKVAINSFRGNGGGDLLTWGAKINPSVLKSRILASSEFDLRYYLMEKISRERIISPYIMSDWKFIPEKWAEKGKNRDLNLLFPEK